jgi:hypothetical protein
LTRLARRARAGELLHHRAHGVAQLLLRHAELLCDLREMALAAAGLHTARPAHLVPPLLDELPERRLHPVLGDTERLGEPRREVAPADLDRAA